MAKFGCVKSWMLSDDIVASIILHGYPWVSHSHWAARAAQTIKRWGKKQKKTYLVGELRRQSPIDWRVYRAQFPKLERTQNTKLFSSFYSKDQFAICWWSQNMNSCMRTTKSSTFELPQLQVLQKKTWQHGKNKTLWDQNGICWLTPLFGVFLSSSNCFTDGG